MEIRFKYLVEDVDRHGNVRLYVRVPGRHKIRLRAQFGTDTFLAAYTAAVSDHVTTPRQAREAKPGSFRHLCVLYYGSPTFKRLDPATQSWRRRALDSICEKHADKPVALMEARHVRMLRDERSDQPGAANQRLKAIRALFGWASEEKPELVPQNPTLGVRKIKYATNGTTHGLLTKSSNIATGIRSAARRAWRLIFCSTQAADGKMRSALGRSMCATVE